MTRIYTIAEKWLRFDAMVTFFDISKNEFTSFEKADAPES